MSRNISILISAKDNFSQAIATMRNANQHFNKDLEGLQEKLNTINKTRTTLKLDTNEAKKNLTALQKEYDSARKAGDKLVSGELLKKLEDANDAYEQARRNLSLLDKEARSTEKSMTDMGGAFSKLENRAAGGGKTGVLAALGKSGALKMGGDLLAGIANAYVSSAFGDESALLFSSMLSGAASGAAIGSIMPGIGTAVGSALGAAAGAVSGATQIAQSKDEAYKSVVREQYDAISQKRAEELTAGSAIAAQREMDQIAFSKLLKGDTVATEYLDSIRTMANTTPFLYDDLKGISKTLATYGYDPAEMQTALTHIGDTGSALGMSTSDMAMVATGLGRMRSSGKTSLEYLNILIERGIPAIDYLADAMGASNQEVYDMVSKGLIPGAQAAQEIAKAMGEANSGAMAEMGDTFSGLMSTKEGLEQELQNAMGEGFNTTRGDALKEQNAFLDPESETGQQMQEAYRLIGEYKANLENEREKAWRDAMTTTMSSDDYIAVAKANDGAKMGEMLAVAEVEAETAYRNSDGYKLYEKTEKNTVQRLQIALVDDWENFGYEMGKVFTTGRMAAINDLIAEERERLGIRNTKPVEYALNYEYGTGENFSGSQSFSDAYGLSYVPYDNYSARLHEGERVLTASQARAYNSGGSISITVTGNEFIVREDADIDRIAAQLASKLREAQMVS